MTARSGYKMNKLEQKHEMYRQLYIDFLNEKVTYEDRHGRGERTGTRVRFPKQYETVKTTPLGDSIDLTTISRTKHGIWIWSDQHFGHKNIIKYANRPFDDIDEMREAMIRNHNELVTDEDYVIWVGDVAFLNDDKANEILHRLNGYKILIVGNHDMHKKKLKRLHVDEVHLVYNIEVAGAEMVFTHFPITNLPKPIVNIHGHTHDTEDQSVQHMNVSVERIDYKPVNFDNIIDEAQSRTLKMITG